MKIELGDEVKDNITGYQGIVVGLCEYVWQKESVGIQAKMNKEGDVNDVHWMDYNRIKIIKKNRFNSPHVFPKIINLGDEVEDIISGFKGIAVERAIWLWGCNRICIQPKVKKNNEKIKDSCWFDESSIKTINKKIIKEKKEKRGGPSINTPTQNIK